MQSDALPSTEAERLKDPIHQITLLLLEYQKRVPPEGTDSPASPSTSDLCADLDNMSLSDNPAALTPSSAETPSAGSRTCSPSSGTPSVDVAADEDSAVAEALQLASAIQDPSVSSVVKHMCHLGSFLPSEPRGQFFQRFSTFVRVVDRSDGTASPSSFKGAFALFFGANFSRSVALCGRHHSPLSFFLPWEMRLSLRRLCPNPLLSSLLVSSALI